MAPMYLIMLVWRIDICNCFTIAKIQYLVDTRYAVDKNQFLHLNILLTIVCFHWLLEPDEIHLLGILTNRPLITVTLDGETGQGFHTFVGICQGDCLSAVLFIFYLACALREKPDVQISKDLKAHLDIYYADDLTYASTSKALREEIKTDTPARLKAYNLFANETNTEEGEAPDKRPPPPPPLEDPGDRILWSELDWLIPAKTKPPEPSYKSMQLLGTKLDTKCDIITRKGKVWNPIKRINITSDQNISASNTKSAFSNHMLNLSCFIIVRHGLLLPTWKNP